jgi:sugar lactone lactonase YvrE
VRHGLSPVDVALDARAGLGEGPWWDVETQRLLWIDLHAGLVHRFDPATSANDKTIDVGQPVGMVAGRAAGGLLVAVRDGLGVVDAGWTTFEVTVPIELGDAANRMNDGKCDPAGRLWVGTMAFDQTPGAGTVYRVDGDLSVTPSIPRTTTSNGIDWSVDGRTMYHVDTATCTLDAYDYDVQAGAISGRRRLVDFPVSEGRPDGMAVDAEDTLWVAMWDGGAVRRYRPTGELLDVVDIPCSRVTSVAFGGPDLSTLYITSARHELPEAQLAREPLAGAIFALDAGVSGQPMTPFAG